MTYYNSEATIKKFSSEFDSLNKNIQEVDTKKNALLLIENNYLDSYFWDTVPKYTKHLSFKGNVDKVLIYRELKRHKQEFDVVFKNRMVKQKFFANPFEHKTEILNRKGEVIKIIPIGRLEFIYEETKSMNRGFENTHYLRNSDSCYYFNHANKEIIKMSNYSWVSFLTSNLVKAYDKERNAVTILDNNMSKVIDAFYYNLELNGEIIKAKNEYKKYVILDKKGKQISPQEFHSISPNYKGLYRVSIVDNNTFRYKEGFINSKGKWIVKPEYEFVGNTYKKDNINLKGELQIVEKYDGYGLIDLDKNAKLTVPCKYDYLRSIINTNGKLYIAKQNNNYGIIDINNNILHPIKYSREEIEKLSNSMKK